MRRIKLFGKRITDKRIKIQIAFIDSNKYKKSVGMTVYIRNSKEFDRLVKRVSEKLKEWYGSIF